MRGIGLLAAVELVQNRETKEKFAADGEEVNALNALLIEKGLLTRASHMIMLSPPLCMTQAEVDRMVGIIDDALTAFEKKFSYC